MAERFGGHPDSPDRARRSGGEELLAPLLPAGEPVEKLLRKAQFFVPGGAASEDFRTVSRSGGRDAERF